MTIFSKVDSKKSKYSSCLKTKQKSSILKIGPSIRSHKNYKFRSILTPVLLKCQYIQHFILTF